MTDNAWEWGIAIGMIGVIALGQFMGWNSLLSFALGMTLFVVALGLRFRAFSKRGPEMSITFGDEGSVFVQPVLLSTPEHVNKYAMVCRDASLFERLSGRYKLPEGFPCVRKGRGCLPSFAISYGVVTLHGDEASFRAISSGLGGLEADEMVHFDHGLELVFPVPADASLFRMKDPTIASMEHVFIELKVDGAEWMMSIGAPLGKGKKGKAMTEDFLAMLTLGSDQA